MSDQFIGEVRFVSFKFPPKTWAFCNGQIMNISQNQALFAVLGTAFGGNGTTTFGLPNLQGRVAMHGTGGGNGVGGVGGEETHQLTIDEMPRHNHQVMASSGNADNVLPATRALAVSNTPSGTFNLYSTSTSTTPLRAGMIAPTGGGQGHPNMQPYAVIVAIVALSGIFPSRN